MIQPDRQAPLITPSTVDISGMEPGKRDYALGYEGYKEGVGDYKSGLDLGAKSREEQMIALGLMRGAAEGTAPSAAERAMTLGMQESLANQAALAASARGGAAGQLASRRQAAMTGAEIGQKTIGQVGVQRAAEMEAARAAYMAGASGIRQGDIGTAGLGLEAGRTGLQAGHLGLESQKVGLMPSMLDAQLAQQAASSNQAAQLAMVGMDDAQRRAYMQNLMGIDVTTMAGNQAYWDQLFRQNNLANQLRFGQSGANAAADVSQAGMWLNLASGGLAGALAGSNRQG
jgi:hypothetical protein